MNLKNTLAKYAGKPNSLFKKIFVVSCFAHFPFVVLFSILTIFGLMPVKFNDVDYFGLKGVAVLVCFAPFMIFMLSAFAYLWFVFGNFVLRIIIAVLPDKKS